MAEDRDEAGRRSTLEALGPLKTWHHQDRWDVERFSRGLDEALDNNYCGLIISFRIRFTSHRTQAEIRAELVLKWAENFDATSGNDQAVAREGSHVGMFCAVASIFFFAILSLFSARLLRWKKQYTEKILEIYFPIV